MPKLLTIQIPQPCGEDPAGMLPSANGSYCNSCKKEVIDFTLMSDDRVAAFLSRQAGHICGRFYPDQLDRAIPIPKKQLPWAKYFFTIALPAFLLSLKSTAQHKNITTSHVLADHKFHAGKDILLPEYPAVFTGTIVDQKGIPVEGASVQIVDSRRGTTTDQNGEFEISLQRGDNSILISGIAFKTKEISVGLKQAANIIVERTMTDLDAVLIKTTALGVHRTPMMLGGAVITSVTTTTVTRQKAIAQTKITNEINIYPNPVHSGAELNISWKNKVESDQLIEVFSADAQLIQKETVRITGKISACSFVLKETGPGFYIFMVTDMKTGGKMSKEFIVE